MLFYHFDMLDNFIETNSVDTLKKEKENIEQIIKLYENKKINLSSITTNMVEIASSIHKKRLDRFYDTLSSLKKLFEDISAIQVLASKLEKNLNETIALYDKDNQNNKYEIKANLVEYNRQRDSLLDKILQFENKSIVVLNSATELTLNKKAKRDNAILKPSSSHETKRIDIELQPHDNNTLIISEKDQKAYLPFFYADIKRIYESNTSSYQTLQDVVNHLYVLPLNKFKNSTLARFRESFYLIREKEKGSITKALDLGLELMFHYELNPIVIAACRNLDELDIYLDCLQENELYDFTCFEIKFEIMPQLAKNAKKNTFFS